MTIFEPPHVHDLRAALARRDAALDAIANLCDDATSDRRSNSPTRGLLSVRLVRAIVKESA